MAQAPEAGCIALTAVCGFGYNGQCCCECALQLVARPKCHHLSGPRPCGSEPEPDEKTGYVCLVFIDEGIAHTEWSKHGACEAWTPRDNKPRRVASG